MMENTLAKSNLEGQIRALNQELSSISQTNLKSQIDRKKLIQNEQLDKALRRDKDDLNCRLKKDHEFSEECLKVSQIEL